MTKPNESIVRLTTEEFNDLIKIIRMLYGVQAATYIFERNSKEFYNFSAEVLHKIPETYKVESPRANNKRIEVKNG